jgi:hypothetical protein
MKVQSNKEFLAEFALRAGFSILVMFFFLAFVYGLGKIDEGRENGAQPESRFKVIDQYGPCEVVRFMPKGEAKYVYFLDCK